MLKPIIFWGASGQAKVLYDFIEIAGYELVAIFDNQHCPPPIKGIPIHYKKKGFLRWMEATQFKELFFLVAIGGHLGKDRVDIQKFLLRNKICPALAIHPTAFVSKTAIIGDGTQVLMNASIGVEVILGDACIVNSSANIDHECTLGKGVHVGPGACLTGCIKIGDFSMIGAGSIILPRVIIGSGVIVGAGAIVTKNIPDNSVVIGNPARLIKTNKNKRENNE
jgi:sugar O-acyltransferase (sialic acid O-acetyltransferase NeuD family)